jgi:hypothetical protein
MLRCSPPAAPAAAAARRGGAAAAAPRCAPSPRAAAPQRRGAAAAAGRAPGGGAADEPQPVLLNAHTLWLQAAGGERPTLRGGDYVLFPSAAAGGGGAAAAGGAAPRRGRRGSGGLVPWQRPGGLARGAPAPSLRDAALVVLPAAGPAGIVPFSGEPVVLAGDGFIEAEAVDAEVLPPAPGPHPLPPSTTAIVPRAPAPAAGLVPAAGRSGDACGDGGAADAEGVYETFSSSPRRGHKIKFTCRRCGATSIRPINIHAWREVRGPWVAGRHWLLLLRRPAAAAAARGLAAASLTPLSPSLPHSARQGTVFARCGKCRVTHKLIDNLQLFHEMAGPVFDAPADPALPLPPGLELRLEDLLGPGGGPGVVGGYEGFPPADWTRGVGGADGAGTA